MRAFVVFRQSGSLGAPKAPLARLLADRQVRQRFACSEATKPLVDRTDTDAGSLCRFAGHRL